MPVIGERVGRPYSQEEWFEGAETDAPRFAGERRGLLAQDVASSEVAPSRETDHAARKPRMLEALVMG